MIKLIVSDMDGTLLNDKMEISESNISAIQEAKRHDIEFMVATGRGYSQATPALNEAGLHCPIITLNGGQVFNEDGTIVENLGISKETTRMIVKSAKAHQLYCEIVTSSGVWSDDKIKRIESTTSLLYETNPETSYKIALVLATARLEMMNIRYTGSFYTLLEDDSEQVLKILIFSDVGQTELDPVRKEFETNDELNITSSFWNNIEINNAEAQKGIALQKYAKKKNIPLDRIMTIGDNFNDVSMLKIAGVSFAMENAEPEVKKQAKYLTSKNIENGVGEAIIRAINENL